MTGYALLLGLSLTLGLTYWLFVRRVCLRWGANAEDLARGMRGDKLVPDPTYETTLAVTIDAPAEYVWPWLAQRGFRRGGLYSYDWLDRLFGYLDAQSADDVLPQFQHLAGGDVIPIGRGPGFPVLIVDPNHSLVLGGEADRFCWIWQFGLYPTRGRTRLVSRNRARVPASVGSWLFMRLLEPAAFLMTRKMLLGIKRRAEALAVAEQARAARAARRRAHRRSA